MPETPDWLDDLAQVANDLSERYGTVGDGENATPPRLVLIGGGVTAEGEESEPTADELLKALAAPGPLNEQDAVRRLMSARAIHADALRRRRARPNLTLVIRPDAA